MKNHYFISTNFYIFLVFIILLTLIKPISKPIFNELKIGFLASNYCVFTKCSGYSEFSSHIIHNNVKEISFSTDSTIAKYILVSDEIKFVKLLPDPKFSNLIKSKSIILKYDNFLNLVKD